jgi:hypothetical protein
MTWHIVVHDKGQAISNTEKQMFFEKLHTVSQDLRHVCQSQSNQQCAVVMTTSHKAALFSQPFLHAHTSQNMHGVNNVRENLETVKQQNSTKFANFSTCHDQTTTEVHEQSETVMLWANEISQDVSC